MMKCIKAICYFIFFGLGYSYIYPVSLAQETTQNACLTFQKAKTLITTLDPDIGTAKANQTEAEADLQEARAEWYPQLSTYGRAASGSVGLTSGRTDNQVGVVLNQRVFDFGHGNLSQKTALAQLDAARYRVQSAHDASLYDGLRAFLEVLKAQEKREVAYRRERNFAEINTAAARRLELKLITIAEASSIAGDYALARANRLEEDLSVNTTRSNLFVLIGSPILPCPNLDEIQKMLSENLPEDMSSAIAEALFHNPEIRAQEAIYESRKSEYKREQRRNLPIVAVEGVAAYVYDDLLNSWDDNYRVGLDISVPLWSGGRYRANVNGARARRESATMEWARVKREIESRVSLAWHRVIASDLLLKARREARENLSREADAIAKEFENGLRSYQDLEQVEADLQSSILSEIDARYEIYNQQLTLMILTHRFQ